MTVISCDILQFFRLLLVVLLQRVQPLGLDPVTGHLVQDLNLVKGSDQVVAGRPLDFKSNKGVVNYILGKPNSWEVTPTQLLNDKIPIDEHFSHMHRMVPSKLVIWHTFILRWVRIVIARKKQRCKTNLYRIKKIHKGIIAMWIPTKLTNWLRVFLSMVKFVNACFQSFALLESWIVLKVFLQWRLLLAWAFPFFCFSFFCAFSG